MRGFFLLADERAFLVYQAPLCGVNEAQMLQDLPTILLLSSPLKSLCLFRVQISNLGSTWSH